VPLINRNREIEREVISRNRKSFPSDSFSVLQLLSEKVNIRKWDVIDAVSIEATSASSMASVQSSVINLTKTIIGAGLLAIPFAFKADGIVLGLALTLVAAMASSYGLNIVTRCSVERLKHQETSFFALCAISYPRLSLLFDFSIFLQCFGVGLSYLVLVGDIVPGLIDHVLSRNQVILLSLAVTIPLVSLRKLDSLKIGSLIGLFAIFYLTLLVISHALFDDISKTQGNLKVWSTGSWSDIMSSFSIVVFAFTGAMNICTITNEIEDKKKSDIVVYSAVGIAGALFVVVGISGYLQFGDNVTGNVILNYDSDLISTKIGKYSLVVMVILSYPLMFHPCRISLNNMVHWIESEYKSRKAAESQPLLVEAEVETSEMEVIPLSTKRFTILSVLLTIAIYGLALSINSFELVLALVGATGSTLICFILPGLFGYRLFESSNDKLWSLLLCVWGILVMILSLFATLH
jgi:amino acid permease